MKKKIQNGRWRRYVERGKKSVFCESEISCWTRKKWLQLEFIYPGRKKIGFVLFRFFFFEYAQFGKTKWSEACLYSFISYINIESLYEALFMLLTSKTISECFFIELVFVYACRFCIHSVKCGLWVSAAVWHNCDVLVWKYL